MMTDEQLEKHTLIGEMMLVLRTGTYSEKTSLLRAISQLDGDGTAQNARLEYCPEISEFEWYNDSTTPLP